MRPALQRLSKGKFLNDKNFPTYVDTHNYLADVAENTLGDFDIDARQGYIEYDVQVPDHPVIRLKNVDKLLNDAKNNVLGDADEESLKNTNSVQSYELSSNPRVFEIYKFHDKDYTGKDDLSALEFICRKNKDAQGHDLAQADVIYRKVDVSALVNGLNSHLPGDADLPAVQLSSITRVDPDPNDKEKSYYELFNWTGSNVSPELSTDDLLIRRNGVLEYLNIENMYKSNQTGDTNLKPEQQKSIDLCVDLNNKQYYQLHDFNISNEITGISVNLDFKTATTILSNEIVQREYIDNVPTVTYLPPLTLSVGDPTGAVNTDAETVPQKSVEHNELVEDDKTTKYLQLYQFDDKNYHIGFLSAAFFHEGEVLLRIWTDGHSELQYGPLSDLYVDVDHDITQIGAVTDSVQFNWLPVQGGMLKHLMLKGFNGEQALTKAEVKNSVEPNLLIRRIENGKYILKYAELSAVETDVDTDATVGKNQSWKSIEWSNDFFEHFIQLYKFDDGVAVKPNLSADHFLIRRKNGNEMYLEYVNLSAYEYWGDADVDIQNDGGITTWSVEHNTTNKGRPYFSLFNFDENETVPPDVETDDVLIRRTFKVGNKTQHILEYVDLSSAGGGSPHSGDTNRFGVDRSIELQLDPVDGDYYELVGWNSKDERDIDKENDHILVRYMGEDVTQPELNYVTVSSLTIPTDNTLQKSNSLEIAKDGNDTFYRMYKFDQDGISTVISAEYENTVFLSDEIIVRQNGKNGDVNYLSTGLYLPNPTPAVDVDTDIEAWKQRSIEHKLSDDVDALQVYNFDDGEVDDVNIGNTNGSAKSGAAWYAYCHKYYGDSDGFSPLSASYRLQQYSNGCYHDAEMMHRNRFPEGGGREVKYDTMDVVLPTYVRCDYDMGCGNCGPNPFGCTSRSLQMRFMDDTTRGYGAKYYELYNFHNNIYNGDGTLTCTHNQKSTWSSMVNVMAYVRDGNELGCFERPVIDNAFGQDEEAQFVLRSTDRQSFATSISYQKMTEKLPPFIRPDTTLNELGWDLHNTLEIKNAGCDTFEDTYWQLYNWGCDNGTLSVDLSANLTADVGQKILMVSQDGKSLEYHDITFIAPDASNMRTDINNIYGDITNIWDKIYELSGMLSGDLSAYWIKGGDYTDNWGMNIGYGCPGASQADGIAIGLTNKTLYGEWSVTDKLTVTGCGVHTDVVGGYGYSSQNYMNMWGSFYFGCGLELNAGQSCPVLTANGDIIINQDSYGCGGSLRIVTTTSMGCENGTLYINNVMLNADRLRRLLHLIGES